MMTKPFIQVKDLTLSYGDYVVMHDLTFDIRSGDIFIIMGPSGCGKSSLLRALTGLIPVPKGQIIMNGIDVLKASPIERETITCQSGILYQSGALFSAMTLEENVALPLQQQTDYSAKTIHEIVNLKLALVGLAGFNDFYPSEISGGMKKRAGLARALALDPKIVYFDEPSAGLDPVSSKALDDLIQIINQSLGTTIVMVTHELPSLMGIGTNGIFLDCVRKTITGYGSPRDLLKNPPNSEVYKFLTRGVSYESTTK